MKNELIAYAQSFVSFFIQTSNDEERSSVKNIILFGSVARGEAGKDSDIDIFIDIYDKQEKIEKLAKKIVIEFRNSQISKKYWDLLGIKNEVKPIIGVLEKWPDLHPSIISDGIVLYGKYKAALSGKPKVIFFWNKIDKESKRVMISKQLYGYGFRGKQYVGVLDKIGGKKLGSNCILVNLELAATVSTIFKKQGVPLKRIYIEES